MAAQFLPLQHWGILEVTRAPTYGQREMLRLCLANSLRLELSLVGLRTQEGG